uniref:Transcription factor PAR1-like n=1 Tax=Nicotiana sylvestris TaxID=4096 RepID=A0A1U7YBM6_NICSY|nr:PREDICTED: transcription factor PAR1-like [Nicotiana sylvestris]
MVSRSNICSRKSTQQRRRRPKTSTATLPTNANTSVSEKLEALKQLLPALAANNGEIKVDHLFQETADYIVLLRTQVFILQKLLHFCDDIGQSQDI